MKVLQRQGLRWTFAAALLAAALDSGCGGGGGGFFDVDLTDLKPGLSGSVADATTGKGIANATVTVQGKHSLTGAAGEYSLSDLRPGRHPVSVAHANYVSLEREVEITTSIVNFANFELQPLP